MNEANGAPILVDQVNRAAISYVNAKADIPLVRDQPVATFEAEIGGDYRIDDGYLISVNLPRGNESPISHPKRLPRLPVCLVEVLQHNMLVVRQFNFRNPTHKTVLAPKM